MKPTLSRAVLALVLLVGSRPAVAAQTITQWNFENQPVTGSPPYNNSPLASTGTGMAIVLGMTNTYGTPGPSVTAADILADPGGSDPTSLQAWRIRGQAGTATATAANGWSSLAPQFTQGAEFDVSTAGFRGVNILFDWQPTNRGIADVELQYNLNVADANGWINGQLFSNTVAGGVWNNGNTLDLSSIAGASNDATFGIRIVSAYHAGTSTYLDTNGAPLNNNSGNIRLDNVTISGISTSAGVPEPASIVLLSCGVAGFVILRQRGR